MISLLFPLETFIQKLSLLPLRAVRDCVVREGDFRFQTNIIVFNSSQELLQQISESLQIFAYHVKARPQLTSNVYLVLRFSLVSLVLAGNFRL